MSDKVRATYSQRLKVKRFQLQRELDTLSETIADIEASREKSVTISTGDGQKSATDIELQTLLDRRDEIEGRIASINRRLCGRSGVGIVHQMTVRS